jgi:hypothetical protein
MANQIITIDGGIFLPIQHSVGRGGRNLPGDVRMVQFLLDMVHLDPGNSFRMASLLIMDGLSGPLTEGGIVAYQTFKRDQGPFPSYAIDGRVDATKHMMWAGAGRFGYSTLFNLNFDFALAAPRVNPAMFQAYVIEPFFSDVILPLQKMGVL